MKALLPLSIPQLSGVVTSGEVTWSGAFLCHTLLRWGLWPLETAPGAEGQEKKESGVQGEGQAGRWPGGALLLSTFFSPSCSSFPSQPSPDRLICY